MFVCTFLGHKEVYDKDIYEKLTRAVYGLVEEHDEAEFLFYNQGTFYDLCLAAVLEARQRFPQKRISITWVVPAEERERFAADLAGGRGKLPPCVADRVAAPPPVSGSPITAHRKVERWTIQQSTHLISYLYFAFCAPENRQYFYARAAGLTVLDMTSPETAARILEGAAALPEREGLALRGALEGRSHREIGEILGISSSAAQQLSQRAGRSLRRAARQRLVGLWGQEPAPPVQCGIFALGPLTYESLSAFEQAVRFLWDRYHVRQFNIAAEYCRSGYINVLRRIVSPGAGWDVQLVAITHCPEMPEEAWKETVSSLIPPCDAVENVDTQARRPRAQWLRTAKAIIERSDFCICNLSDQPLADSIGRHASKVQGAKLLDLGKKFAGSDGSPAPGGCERI